MTIPSKLPNVGTTIFTVMSGLANQHGAINLSQGFPNFNPSERLQRLVFEHMQRGDNQYAPMPGVPLLRERIAEKMTRLYGQPLSPDTEITVTAGGTQAIFCAIAAFVGPGDEIILIEPCYDSYRPSVETVGGKVVAYPLSAPEYRIDWTAVGRLISPRTRMICINTPNNPTGTLLRESDMLALSNLLKNTDVLVLSDEVYEHLIFDGEPHASALRYPDLYARSLCIYSFGKTYHNTGWKTGYCIAPPELTREFRKVHQFNVFSGNHPMQAAFADFMADPSEYTGLPEFYQKKRDAFQQAMAGTRFRPVHCSGTYFQLYDYSAISNEPDLDFCKRLTIEFGVAAIPVSSFFSDRRDDKVIRFCFAKTEDLLEQAGERLRKV
ncbi:MAG: aminotransferase class I/II-fold pyridoxal phosphate-dependent enzyme [Saprospiraceae bacterium]|jgi:methionine aminotransferase|nr:aminotransferase class I/II-fold pyridoxal phosphate-dependent enzyme [Saprospiraceae bacterium]